MTTPEFRWESEQKCAEDYLLKAVLMHKQRGFTLWYLLKMAAKMWEHTVEERQRIERWVC